MLRKTPDWVLSLRKVSVTKWTQTGEDRKIESLKEDLDERDSKYSPSYYADSLETLRHWSFAKGALGVMSGDWSRWGDVHLAWRAAALLAESQIQYLEHRIAEFRKKDKVSPITFRQVTFTELNTGALAWCLAVVFKEKKFVRMWGDRMVQAVANNETLLEETAFVDASPFELGIVKLHAFWHKLPFRYDGPLPTDWPIYARIFENWDAPLAKFRDAVQRLCDYHCEHCWDLTWGGHQAFLPKPYEIFPVEILALKIIRYSLGLSFPELNHKLVDNNPLFAPPEPIPKAAATDEWEVKTITRMREVFPQLKLPFDELPFDPSLSKSSSSPNARSVKKVAQKSALAKKAVKKKLKK